MEIDRQASAILFSFAWRIRRLRVYWEHTKRTIRSYNFEVSEWTEYNQNELTAITQLYRQYEMLENRNREVIAHYNVFHFYWQQVVDCFTRETPQWRVDNMEFLIERIVHANWMEQMIRNEMDLLNNRDAQQRRS